MTKLACFVLLPLVACAAPRPQLAFPAASAPVAAADAPTLGSNRLALHLGSRALTDDVYGPADEPRTIGVEVSRTRPGDLAGFEAALFHGRADKKSSGVDTETRVSELAFGVRRDFDAGAILPYVGVGLAIVRSDVEVEGGLDDNGGSLAGYLHAGFDLPVSEAWFVGFDGRVLFGSDIEFTGTDTSGDYAQATVTFGLRF